MAPFPDRAKLLGDVRAAAQHRIKTATFADAEKSRVEIETIGGEIARAHGGVIAGAPLKSMERASEKVALDYGGDWHQIKDIARMTIVVPTLGACAGVLNDIRKRFAASRGGGVIQVKDVQAAQDPCGYSSTTVFVRTSTGRAAEIQINVPEIIYAKQSESSVTRVIGPGAYAAIRSRFRLEGGMGHALYEIYRAPRGGQDPQKAARLSKRYYDYFRRGGFNQVQCAIIRGELRDFGLLSSAAGF